MPFCILLITCLSIFKNKQKRSTQCRLHLFQYLFSCNRLYIAKSCWHEAQGAAIEKKKCVKEWRTDWFTNWCFKYEIPQYLNNSLLTFAASLVRYEAPQVVSRTSLTHVITDRHEASLIWHRDAFFHCLTTWHLGTSASRANNGLSLALRWRRHYRVLAFCQYVRVVLAISGQLDGWATRAVSCLNLALLTFS